VSDNNIEDLDVKAIKLIEALIKRRLKINNMKAEEDWITHKALDIYDKAILGNYINELKDKKDE
jgi:hypothetical protein